MRQSERDQESRYRSRFDDLLMANNQEVLRRREAERHNAVLRLEITKLNRNAAKRARHVKRLRDRLKSLTNPKMVSVREEEVPITEFDVMEKRPELGSYRVGGPGMPRELA